MSDQRRRQATMAYLETELEDVASSWDERGHNSLVITLAYIRQEAGRLLREAPPEAELERATLRNIHRRAERLLARIHRQATGQGGDQ